MTGATVSVCEACGWQGFPRRVWCPACGGYELASAFVDSGAVTQVSVLEHAIGRALPGGVRVANVAMLGGGSLIARLEGDLTESVRLSVHDGIPVASRAD